MGKERPRLAKRDIGSADARQGVKICSTSRTKQSSLPDAIKLGSWVGHGQGVGQGLLSIK